ncbi:hypothetical protein [Sulfurisphaera tokodaii]|uniref:Uncharacterized protein n=2 Tax=Sulfurisphaera tokodaii TaxID=111955 RepID=Q96ZZ3_SULTO|nr:hypothetical protein [Sulfurisphaera tokodaii]BAB66780.1 hypothetical protein STK_16980 [Sulfurisphaera tokodaii str. 7]HII73118.1 hypothetical protein [Sulfurisphaera tokodaii]
MSQINFNRIPGLIAVYKIDNDSVIKIYGKDINIDINKLKNIIMENMRIGKDEAKKLKLIDPFLGFAMVVDDIGITYLSGLIVITEAKKTNWDFLIKSLLKEVGVYEKS